jgi:4'-phosphopantetheinyl transferase
VELGVDVERLDLFTTPAVETVVLHPAERATTAAELATAWVRKEALLKASGDGLSVDPASVRLVGTLGSPAVVEWPVVAARPDWLVDLGLADDLSAAIAGGGIGGPGELTVRQAGPGVPPG